MISDPTSRPASSRLRRGRTSETGRVYLVTFATAGRRPIFSDWQIAHLAAAALSNPDAWTTSRLLCWVLMPDHWHGLIELGESVSLPGLVRRLKGRCSRQLNLAMGRNGPLWMSGFHDHTVRSDEQVISIARYIVLNPVRAGIVARIGLYPFWNAIWLARG